jgi:hypothetical protein
MLWQITFRNGEEVAMIQLPLYDAEVLVAEARKDLRYTGWPIVSMVQVPDRSAEEIKF